MKGDLLVFGNVHTLDPTTGDVQAFACREGRIVQCGSREELLQTFPKADKLDLKNRHIYPGFIDPHCHFVYYGLEKFKLNLRGIQSAKALLSKTSVFGNHTRAPWISGRGWNQEIWADGNLPSLRELDDASPDRPLILTRIDGHAALVNSLALEAAGLKHAPQIDGGTVVQHKGKATGLLLDRAMDRVFDCMPPPSEHQIEQAVQRAQSDCFSFGLTSVHDAGLGLNMYRQLQKLEAAGKLHMGIYMMLNPDEQTRNYFAECGPVKSHRLNCRSFKYYADGALGSKGARMLEPYDVEINAGSSNKSELGLWLNSESYLQQQAQFNAEQGFQMNTHAIGDAANRLMLDVYGKTISRSTDHRWRIEHAQIVHPDDFRKFGDYGIIPSVQSTHATSDALWVEKRIGKKRLKGAYALKSLAGQNGWLANGSDFPIESADPLDGYYAAVFRTSRKDAINSESFLPDEALSRKQALLAMTGWAARSAFEEDERGMLSEGMRADFVVLDTDLENASQHEIQCAGVLMTAIDGQIVYSK